MLIIHGLTATIAEIEVDARAVSLVLVEPRCDQIAELLAALVESRPGLVPFEALRLVATAAREIELDWLGLPRTPQQGEWEALVMIGHEHDQILDALKHIDCLIERQLCLGETEPQECGLAPGQVGVELAPIALQPTVQLKRYGAGQPPHRGRLNRIVRRDAPAAFGDVDITPADPILI